MLVILSEGDRRIVEELVAEGRRVGRAPWSCSSLIEIEAARRLRTLGVCGRESAVETCARREREKGMVLMSDEKKVTLEFIQVGKKGKTAMVAVWPGGLFRGEVFSATDSLDGIGVRIDMVYVGGKAQLSRKGVDGRYRVGLPVREVVRGLRDGTVIMEGGETFDVCDPALMVTIQITFLEDCEFRAQIKGTMLKESRS